MPPAVSGTSVYRSMPSLMHSPIGASGATTLGKRHHHLCPNWPCAPARGRDGGADVGQWDRYHITSPLHNHCWISIVCVHNAIRPSTVTERPQQWPPDSPMQPRINCYYTRCVWWTPTILWCDLCGTLTWTKAYYRNVRNVNIIINLSTIVPIKCNTGVCEN